MDVSIAKIFFEKRWKFRDRVAKTYFDYGRSAFYNHIFSVNFICNKIDIDIMMILKHYLL